LKSAGFTEEMLAVVKQLHPAGKGALSDKQYAVLKYADAMTREVWVPQSLFDEVKAQGFSDQQMVELTATVASYNMVSRFLVALDIGEQNAKAPDWAKEHQKL
jgi:alkylhydroperoxidase family enzyme